MISSMFTSGRDGFIGSGRVSMYSSVVSLIYSFSSFFRKVIVACSSVLFNAPADTNFDG